MSRDDRPARAVQDHEPEDNAPHGPDGAGLGRVLLLWGTIAAIVLGALLGSAIGNLLWAVLS